MLTFGPICASDVPLMINSGLTFPTDPKAPYVLTNFSLSKDLGCFKVHLAGTISLLKITYSSLVEVR
mgnify:FL=1